MRTGATASAGENIQESIGALTHIPNRLLQPLRHRIATEFLPLAVEVDARGTSENARGEIEPAIADKSGSVPASAGERDDPGVIGAACRRRLVVSEVEQMIPAEAGMRARPIRPARPRA